MKVTILNDRGKLRLKYRYGDNVEYISLGLDYNKDNLKIAKAKAKQIESDIIFNCYESKDKYLINPRTKNEAWDFPRILDYYLSAKARDNTTVKSVNILLSWCERSPKRLLFPERLDDWILYLKKEIPRLDGGLGYADSTISSHVKILRASIYFAHDMGKIPKPTIVAKACNLVKTKSKKEVKVYTIDEINLIVDTFRNSSHAYYANLVYFRFLTGCRPSEAIALTWDDIVYESDRTYIRFNKRFSKGELKQGLKNGKPYRYFPCNQQLQLFLSTIPRYHKMLIFPAVQGGYLDTENFGKRHWNPVLDSLIVLGKLKFRIPFYDERHCFGTIVCRQVQDLQTVANIMGNSPTVLQKHYLANDNAFNLPEF